MEVFAIWDNRLNKFYAKGDKKLWPTRQGAIDALMFDLRCITKQSYSQHFKKSEVSLAWLNGDDHYLNFWEQVRFECRKYNLKESDYQIV